MLNEELKNNGRWTAITNHAIRLRRTNHATAEGRLIMLTAVGGLFNY